MTELPSFSRSSLVVASLEIGRVLADRDGVTFRAQGTCMYPAVRPGDVLRIRSCSVADVAVGDIVVCRTPEYLFSHRVIDTGERDGRAYLVTRADRSRRGSDAPTFGDDLLGVVVSINRNGVAVPVEGAAHSWIQRYYLRVRLALVEAEPRARLWLSAAATRVQAWHLYRSAARRWWLHACPRVRFDVRVPLNATLGDAVCRELEPNGFDPRVAWHGRPVDGWTLTAQVNEVREPAAWVRFARSPDGAWRAQESYMRVRYRGTGLDKALLRQAETIVARSGAQIERTP